MSGCDLCGDFPVTLSPRCHMNAPLKAEMPDESTLVLRCYVPTCNREVVRFDLEAGTRATVPEG